MKIDLCRLFGVEEGEEFKIEYEDYTSNRVHKIDDNTFYVLCEGKFLKDNISVETIKRITNIIKLPKKKEFTDDELCILRHIDSEFNILGKNINGTIYVTSDCEKTYLKPFNNLFQILDVGEEIRIDGYVER